MRAAEITSVGWLHNHDGSICLTICLQYQPQPMYVTVSRHDFDTAGGLEGLNSNKQLAVDFYERYGTGRP